jgi:hypothetical protein
MHARQRSSDAGSTRVAMNKAPGVARGFASGLVLPARISAENRESTFPENAPFAWSHFLRKTGIPLFRKMLKRSEVAALEVAA